MHQLKDKDFPDPLLQNIMLLMLLSLNFIHKCWMSKHNLPFTGHLAWECEGWVNLYLSKFVIFKLVLMSYNGGERVYVTHKGLRQWKRSLVLRDEYSNTTILLLDLLSLSTMDTNLHEVGKYYKPDYTIYIKHEKTAR